MTRRRSAKGFVMAEALVALAVAAMTLALLTSATWGLRIASDARAAQSETRATDWLAARRALQGWASGVTAAGIDGTEARLTGTATTARMIVEPAVSGLPAAFAAELRVESRGEDGFVLIAARHLGIGDARLASETPQETEILRASRPIRLLYLLPREGVEELVWRYETSSAGLPVAIAVEVGDQRAVTARLFVTISASCLASLGPGGLEDDQCEIR